MTRTELAGCAIIDVGFLLLLWRTDKRHYEIPGGKVEAAELLEQTAMRETQEEIGCDVDLLGYFGALDFSLAGRDFRSHVYLARVRPGCAPRIQEPDLFGSLFYMPLREAHLYALAPNVQLFCEQYGARQKGGKRG